ncbi:MAG: beta-galactosidase [Eubacteriales bacterium]|nr:beta-galactosidase [Eubacteriales bacterium]
MEDRMRQFRFGADYYPEHWPRERWEQDARMMREMGLQVVRMAEFAWHKMEPEEGRFDFAWLDEAIEILGKQGIFTMLGTPTAAPPAWLIEKEPSILPVDSQGQRKGFGGRHHDCQSNESYRKHVRRIVTAMAEHYKGNPYVFAWQIDNELGNSHGDLCMCESCRRAFHGWLERKYKTIERLNEEWGTVFWSQTYDRFEQIPAPRQTPTVHNPSLLLDWKRFCSDLVIDFSHEQVKILREICPHQRITHNLMGFYDKTDYFSYGEELDFASNDQYPYGYYFEAPGQPSYEVAGCMDFIRSVKHQNFWMMEMQAGPTGGGVIGQAPRPGQLKLWTVQSIAHGADTILYFRWRTCLFGTEQFWHGILPHNGVPGRRYRELKQAIEQMTPVLEDISGVYTRGQAAFLFSYDQDWAIQIQPQHPELSYVEEIQKYYQAFYSHNVSVEFIREEDSFEAYPVLVAPLQYLMRPELEDKFLSYVSGGGILVLTMRTGVKNWNNVCMADRPLPGRLSEAVGAVIEDYDGLIWKDVKLSYKGTEGTARKWADILSLTTAKPLAVYESEFYKGQPAVSVNAYGKGKVYYLGTEPEQKILELFVGDLLEEAGISGYGQTPEGVELVMRKGQKADYLFALNHTEEACKIEEPEGFRSEKSGEIGPYGVRVYRKEHGSGHGGQTVV